MAGKSSSGLQLPLLVQLLLLLATIALAYDESNMTFEFNSRPDLTPQTIQFIINEQNNISHFESHFVLAPFMKDAIEAQRVSLQNAPVIYDLKGNPVYSAYSQQQKYSREASFEFFLGSQHLTYLGGNNESDGRLLIYNESYALIHSESSGFAATNTITFTKSLNEGNTLLILSDVVTRAGEFQPDKDMYIVDCVLREVDMNTGETLYTWNAGSHVSINESVKTGFGEGSTAETAFDYFHCTFVDKAPNGNYILSAGNTNAIYFIEGNGNQGDVFWRLSGTPSDVDFAGFTFSYQHDVRIVSQKDDHYNISFFDNAWNSSSERPVDTQSPLVDRPITNTTKPQSRGMFVSIDTSTDTVWFIRAWTAPNGGLLSRDYGSVQILANSNIFISWGALPFLSEFNALGHCFMHAQFGQYDPNAPDKTVQTTRVVRGPWSATPPFPALDSQKNGTGSAPSLIGYADPRNHTQTRSYGSWNGATNDAVSQWLFSAVANGSGILKPLYSDTVQRNGMFEVEAVFGGSWQAGSAYAIAPNGNTNFGWIEDVPTKRPPLPPGFTGPKMRRGGKSERCICIADSGPGIPPCCTKTAAATTPSSTSVISER